MSAGLRALDYARNVVGEGVALHRSVLSEVSEVEGSADGHLSEAKDPHLKRVSWGSFGALLRTSR
jgi:hypothetical protein